MADADITIQLVGTDNVVAWLNNMTDKIRVRLMENGSRFAIEVQSYIRTQKLSGQVLKQRSGNLSRSISQEVEATPSGIVARIFSAAGPAEGYAGIHEFGGTVNVPAHLRMMKTVFGEPTEPYPVEVRAHTATYPERSYIRTGVRENAERFRGVVALSVAEGIKA